MTTKDEDYFEAPRAFTRAEIEAAMKEVEVLAAILAGRDIDVSREVYEGRGKAPGELVWLLAEWRAKIVPGALPF